ncbi:MAG: SAM-dependent methyltransferase [Proteobacteria bacterium]|nr:SAM-dependent methyltransferase [Pseudomonadota bacterium]MBU4383733.1 SAM-dependent methyltransferase [Pseudomonadota bacterium]MCG2763955.1 SAM-dependent methyltransferase [Desulfarculaceae bacterium]
MQTCPAFFKGRRLNLAAACLTVALLLTMASPAMAVPPGEISWTSQVAAAYRALGAKDPDPGTRNPDYLAGRLLDKGFLDKLLRLPENYQAALAKYRQRGGSTFYYMTARTKYIDQVLTQEAMAGAEQVVILGAGLDSRAYRFHLQFPQVHFFEVDLPATQANKQLRVKAALGGLPPGVAYVAVDFDKDDLGQMLAKAGYHKDRRTLFIWEAVSYYLQEAGVRATLDFVAKQAKPGSRLVFDYLTQEALDRIKSGQSGQRGSAARSRHGEPFTFGIKRGHVRDFLAKSGLKVVEELQARDMIGRFLISSTGQVLGLPSKSIHLVLAEIPLPGR